MHLQRSGERDRNDRGFSLVEILIVVVILGVLATVSVFAVRGITDRGEDSAVSADEQVLVTAQETFHARNGRYATEDELVAAGVLRGASTLHDIVLNADGTYTLTLASAAPTTVP
jgi:general secretion pathway protein G